MKKIIVEAVLIALALVPFIYLATIYDTLPERVPIHFNIDGTADNFSPKINLWIMPAAFGAVIYLIMLLVPIIDPKKKIQLMGGKYQTLRFIFEFFFSLLAAYLIYVSKVGDLKSPNFLTGLLGLEFLMIGNYFQTVRANYFFGIRTPWTLESESVWKKTHRLGGRLWVVGGMLIIIISFVISTNLVLAITFLTIVLTMSIIPVIFSYTEYQKERSLINK